MFKSHCKPTWCPTWPNLAPTWAPKSPKNGPQEPSNKQVAHKCWICTPPKRELDFQGFRGVPGGPFSLKNWCLDTTCFPRLSWNTFFANMLQHKPNLGSKMAPRGGRQGGPTNHFFWIYVGSWGPHGPRWPQEPPKSPPRAPKSPQDPLKTTILRGFGAIFLSIFLVRSSSISWGFGDLCWWFFLVFVHRWGRSCELAARLLHRRRAMPEAKWCCV